MNLPNLLSVLRLLLVPCFFVAFYYSLRGEENLIWVARAILVFIVLSDFMDGYLARTWGEITQLGQFLDPLADKLFVTSAFILLAVFDKVSAWLAIAVVTKDMIISLGWFFCALTYNRSEISPTFLGKTATAFQFLTVCVIILLPSDFPTNSLEYITGFVTILALLNYVYMGMQIASQGNGNKDRLEGRAVDS